MRTNAIETGEGMRLTGFGFAVILLVVLAVAARFFGTRSGSAAAQVSPQTMAQQ